MVLFFPCLPRRSKPTPSTIEDGTTSGQPSTIRPRHGSGSRPTPSYTHVRDLKVREGGFCAVMRCHSRQQLVVVKTAWPAQTQVLEPAQTGRRTPLPNEARMLLSKLRSHPNIIRLYASEADHSMVGRQLLVMEYCNGGDLLCQLQAFRNRDMAVPVMFTLHVFVALSDAFAYLHHGLKRGARGMYSRERRHETIIHGDIKPENILMKWPGTQGCDMPDIVLADFDQAQMESESWGICGSPPYEAPEVDAVARLQHTDSGAFHRARNTKIMTAKSDVYQLGHVIHLMATDDHFPTGADPSLIELPQPYRDVVGFPNALVWMLQPEVSDRAEYTDSLEDGILFAVDVMRRHVKRLFDRSGPLQADLWHRIDLDARSDAGR